MVLFCLLYVYKVTEHARHLMPKPYNTCFSHWHNDDFYWVCRAYRTGEIPTQSNMRLGVFFRKSPKATGRQRVKYGTQK